MGLATVGALVAIILSWLGQSPKLLRRIGLTGLRLDLRVRMFTGYALALLLLAVAFFLAGVPLGTPTESEVAGQESAVTAATVSTLIADESPEVEVTTAEEVGPTPATPETGAFTGPPPVIEDQEVATRSAPAADEQVELITATLPVAASVTSTATVPPATETATPVPTETPSPTLTPTAIVGETALVNSGGSTLWLKRSPGGQNLVLVLDEEVVVLRPGRANQNGRIWRQVATVAGVEGWLQEEFLLVESAESESGS